MVYMFDQLLYQSIELHLECRREHGRGQNKLKYGVNIDPIRLWVYRHAHRSADLTTDKKTALSDE